MDEEMRPREVTHLVSSCATLIVRMAAVLYFLPLQYESVAFLIKRESLFPHPLESELACDLLWPKQCG